LLALLRQISLRQLRESWGRTSLVIGGIALGVALIVAIDVINRSVVANFRQTLELISGPAQLEVTLGVGEVGFAESTVDIVRADPDVVAALPLVRGTLGWIHPRDPEPLQLFGMDLTKERDLARYHLSADTHSDERAQWLLDPRAIAVPSRLATRLGVAVGQRITLSTPQGIRDFTVRGVLEPQGLARAFGGQLALMDIAAAQALLGKDAADADGRRIDQIDIMLTDGANVDAVRARLQAALPPTLTVGTPRQRGAQYEKIVRSFQNMVSGLSLLCLVAGIYIIYNTTSTGAVHRALVIAGLQLIGADARQLFRLLMLEALLIGVVGAVVGLGLGIVLARLLSGLVSDSMGVVFQLRFFVERVELDATSEIGIAVLGVAAALFSSYFAARRVTRLPPLDVLRVDIRSLATRPRSSLLVMTWLILLTASAAALAGEIAFKSALWGNVGSTLWFASSVVIAIPIVHALDRNASAWLARFFGPEGRLAGESLFRSTTRTGVTVAAIALVLAIATVQEAISRSHRESVKTYFTGGFLGSDLIVSATATEGGWLETPLPVELTGELSGVPGVQSVETLRIVPGAMYQGQRITIAALSDGLARRPARWYLDGDAEVAAAAIRQGTGLIASVNFSDHFNVRVGDTVELDTPTGKLPLQVVAIVPDYMADRGAVAIGRRVFEQHWRDSMVNWILLFLGPSAGVDAVSDAIRERLAGGGWLKILTAHEQAAYLAGKIDDAYRFTLAIRLLVLVVTVAGIFDLLIAAVWERRRELALWRVIGADEAAVRRSVVIESATIGLLGSVLGIAVGLVTAWIWTGVHYRYLLGFWVEYHFPLGITALMVALVIVLTIVVGYAAARQATRQSVLEGIQIE